MHGGAEAGIIEGWKREAVVELHEADQGILAGLTLTFAAMAGSRTVWHRGLEGFDVIKSPYLEELREKVRTLARAEGRAEALREAILRLGRQRFGKAAEPQAEGATEGDRRRGSPGAHPRPTPGRRVLGRPARHAVSPLPKGKT